MYWALAIKQKAAKAAAVFKTSGGLKWLLEKMRGAKMKKFLIHCCGLSDLKISTITMAFPIPLYIL
jgi:hypothetical protein